MDWRETGEIIRKRGRRFVSECAKKELAQHPDASGCTLDIPVDWFAEGFLTDGACFVRRRPTREEIDALMYADHPPNGRPREDGTRQAATVAHYFYDAWRSENEKRAIRDYGHRGEMKQYAAEAVVEDYFAWLQLSDKYAWRFPAKTVEAAIEIVLGVMEKPKKRRDPDEGAWVDVQASREGLWLPPKPPIKK